MFRDDESYVKRIIVVGVLILILFSIVAVLVETYHTASELTKRDRIAACKTIQDENLKAGCLDGGYFYHPNGSNN